MGVKNSGSPLSMGSAAGGVNITDEFGGDPPHSLSEYYAGGSHVPAGVAVPTGGQISMSHFYGTVAQAPFLDFDTSGATVSTSGNFKIVVYASSGSFAYTGEGTLEYMVLGGGGPGGTGASIQAPPWIQVFGEGGKGGGAGGLSSGTHPITADGTATFTIGFGGVSPGTSTSTGVAGGTSSISLAGVSASGSGGFAGAGGSGSGSYNATSDGGSCPTIPANFSSFVSQGTGGARATTHNGTPGGDGTIYGAAGGGGIGSVSSMGSFFPNGAGGNGSKGVVAIRYQYQ
jgi:hypothetical protein